MKIEKENVDQLNAVLKVKVEHKDYEEKVETSIRDYRRKANLPGFRPGKVPYELIKQRIGKSILVDEINKLINESVENYIVENKLEIVGRPMLKTSELKPVDLDNQKEFEFLFELGLLPQFSLPFTGNKENVNYYKIKVDDDIINKELEAVRRYYGTMINPDTVEKEDIIYAEFTELSEQGTESMKGINTKATFNVRDVKDIEIEKKLIGSQKGIEFNIDITKIFGTFNEAVKILKLKDGAIKQIKAESKFKIININRVKSAELDQEFFDNYFGIKTVLTTEEFKTKFSLELTDRFGKISENRLHSDITKNLMQNLDLTLPDEFLKKWLSTLDSKDQNDNIAENYKSFAEHLKWTLVEKKIMQLNHIEITDSDIKEYVNTMYLKKHQSDGNEDLATTEVMEATVAGYLQDEKAKNNVRDVLINNKVMGFLKSKYNILEKEVSYQDFIRLKK